LKDSVLKLRIAEIFALFAAANSAQTNKWVESNIVALTCPNVEICFLHVCAVSSTTASNTDRQEFWRWQQYKIWNFEVVSYSWILNLVMIYCHSMEKSIVVAM
jgi:hypothetical protein